MRDYFITIPDRIGVLYYDFLAKINAILVKLVDKYLKSRNETRVSELLEFDELPILYNFDDLPFLRGNFDDEFINLRENLVNEREDMV